MSQRGQGGGLPSVEDRVDQLGKVVSLFVAKVEADFDLHLDFDPGSIPLMDVFLTEVHRQDHDLTPSLYLSIGGYVGETLIRSVGGEWVEGDENLAVELEGEAHSQRLPIFDWVKDACADPHGDSLGSRLRHVIGDDLSADDSPE